MQQRRIGSTPRFPMPTRFGHQKRPTERGVNTDGATVSSRRTLPRRSPSMFNTLLRCCWTKAIARRRSKAQRHAFPAQHAPSATEPAVLIQSIGEEDMEALFKPRPSACGSFNSDETAAAVLSDAMRQSSQHGATEPIVLDSDVELRSSTRPTAIGAVRWNCSRQAAPSEPP